MCLYTAKMKQNPEGIKRYANMQYNLFYFKFKIVGLIFSVLLVMIGGLFVSSGAMSIALVFLGCVLFTNLNAPANFIANRVIACFNGVFPLLNYSFYMEGYSISNSELVQYKKIIRIAEDDEYLYIFQTPQYGVIVKKATVLGDKGVEGLKELLCQKTSLKWEKSISFSNFNLKWLFVGVYG